MLNGARLKNIYSKIQTKLFYMIPEKWDKIYLYAAVIEDRHKLERGEMFFYYFPSGILKKNPVNVYEVPTRFNIEESSYLKHADELYEIIKTLRKEFEKSGEQLWTNITISIVDLKFKIEYNYEDIQDMTDEERHLIWQYKYLNLSPERLQRRQKKILEKYIQNETINTPKVKKHTENMYQKHIHNIIEYDRPDTIEENEGDIEEIKQKKKDKYELYKEEQRKKRKQTEKEEQNEEKKNQILNI